MTDNMTAREVLANAIRVLIEVAEAKDDCFRGYMRAVERLTVKLGIVLGFSEETRQRLRIAAILKDIGRIGLQDVVVNKKGRLSAFEHSHIQSHVLLSEQIVAALFQDKDLCSLVRHHHERHDGTGYPDGLRDEEIPIGSRILAVADAFVAMTQHRPHRLARTAAESLREITANAGSQFCPTVVTALLVIIRPAPDESGESRHPLEAVEN